MWGIWNSNIDDKGVGAREGFEKFHMKKIKSNI